MAANLEIKDGNPVWLSASIIPSKDTVVSPAVPPTLAVVQVNSTNVFTYVKVENTGTENFGSCSCATTGLWQLPVFFPNFIANTNANSTTAIGGGVSFNLNPVGDSLSGGGVNFSFGLSATGRRAWGISPDGRFFAYASAFSPNAWSLSIVTLQQITRSNNTIVPKGQLIVSNSGIFSGPWNNSNFGWAGSKSVICAGQSATMGLISVTVNCPEAPLPNTFGDTLLDQAGQVDWTFRASTCGNMVAIVPKVLNAAAGSQTIIPVSTQTAKQVQFKKSNVNTTITTNGANPSITTVSHTALGVDINPGTGAIQKVDDPDCTFIPGGVMVTVDRVKASTLPSANLGVLSIGTSSIGQLAVGQVAWVQVANTNAAGWNNQSEKHWCLLGQTYTSNNAIIPKPWNGQMNPPPFPVVKVNCAQRNIEILP